MSEVDVKPSKAIKLMDPKKECCWVGVGVAAVVGVV
jgi:hypothetical protein